MPPLPADKWQRSACRPPPAAVSEGSFNLRVQVTRTSAWRHTTVSRKKGSKSANYPANERWGEGGGWSSMMVKGKRRRVAMNAVYENPHGEGGELWSVPQCSLVVLVPKSNLRPRMNPHGRSVDVWMKSLFFTARHACSCHIRPRCRSLDVLCASQLRSARCTVLFWFPRCTLKVSGIIAVRVFLLSSLLNVFLLRLPSSHRGSHSALQLIAFELKN